MDTPTAPARELILSYLGIAYDRINEIEQSLDVDEDSRGYMLAAARIDLIDALFHIKMSDGEFATRKEWLEANSRNRLEADTKEVYGSFVSEKAEE